MTHTSLGIFGSVAFDHLYTFDGAIRDFLATQDSKNISISLFCKNRTVQDGGCGGNITHTLSLLGIPSTLFGTVGQDAHAYMNRLKKQGVCTDFVSFTDTPTAIASLVTDRNQDQYAVFYAGALAAEARPNEQKINDTLSALLVSPEDPDRFAFMVSAAQKNNVPYYCDPGQIITVLPAEFLADALEKSAGLFCNTYELDLIAQKLGLSSEKVVQKTPLSVITNGEHGTTLYTKDGQQKFSAIPAQIVRNVTGCGDAFRAGFLGGISKKLPLETAVKLGTLIATSVVESDRPQIADFSFADFQKRYQSTFGVACPL